MSFSNTLAASVQEVTSAHPTMFDKWIWLPTVTDRSGLSKGAKVVALRLALHHNADTGLCNPSIETLAEELESSIPTIKRELKELRSAGFIEWTTGRNHNSNRYTLRQIRIHGPKGSDIPAYDVPAAQAPSSKPSKRKRKSPATSTHKNVVQFPTTAKTVQSMLFRFPGYVDPAEVSPVEVLSHSSIPPLSEASPVPEMSSRNSSPVSSRNSSPVSSKYLKLNPVRVKVKEEGQLEKESQSEQVTDSPASPLCPEGDGPSETGNGEKKPDSQPEATLIPEDMRLSLALYRMAKGYKDNDQGFITTAFGWFRLDAIEHERKRTDWNAAWMSWYAEACRVEDEKPRPKPAKDKGKANPLGW